MSKITRFKQLFKAFHQLSPSQLGLYALYQLGLYTGHYERSLTASLKKLEDFSSGTPIKFQSCLPGLPDRKVLSDQIGSQIDQLYKEADEIITGNVRLFGGQPIPLALTLPVQLENWSKYEKGKNLNLEQDIKFIWEPGRFGWACKLAMAYHLSMDEQYAKIFWFYTEQFLESNPPYFGPHWASGQEVAIRLMALIYAIQIFSQSKHTTSQRFEKIVKTITIHAERIPPTLAYARSQNNNHLIIEALGLYTASAVLPEHPHANKWHRLGWDWLKRAILTQISADGTYIQHSTNYHRLMLQAALWAHTVHAHSFTNEPVPLDYSTRLEAGTRCLWKLVDPESGCVPNMGHNDGAYILPLSVCPNHDYRPVIQAAARCFLQINLTPNGPWDDMSAWLQLASASSLKETGFNYWHQIPQQKELNTRPPHILVNRKNNSWASLRVGTFTSRPAHADQLHLDLWWRGANLAQDAGTYLYNSPPPWENSLASAFVHNTVVLDGCEFMQRFSRFLYLDWAQARVSEYQSSPDGDFVSITAEHNGYRKRGVIHSRKITILPDGCWEVIDQLDGPPDHIHTARLHWLIPDCEYEIQNRLDDDDFPHFKIRLKSLHGWIRLKMGMTSFHGSKLPDQLMVFTLARAGEVLVGSGKVPPIIGWTSPTYGEKVPALACILDITHTLPIKFLSEWILPDEAESSSHHH
jgi:hypothetical protein